MTLTTLSVQSIQRITSPLCQRSSQESLDYFQLMKVERLLVSQKVESNLSQLVVLILVDELKVGRQGRSSCIGIAIGREGDAANQSST